MISMMCMSAWGPDAETKVYIGYVSCGLIILQLAVSIGLAASHSCIDTKKACRSKTAKWRLYKQKRANKRRLKGSHKRRAMRRKAEKARLEKL